MFLFILTTTLFVLSNGASNNEQRFSNFYSQPEDLKLIAMASEYQPRSGHHPQHHHQQYHHQPQQQQYHQPTRQEQAESDDEPRFSIGLGTLAPSYSQKFGLDGSTRLDFNHRKNGFSYSLTNHHHPETVPMDEKQAEVRGNYESQETRHARSPHINIYHDQDIRERFVPQNAETRNSFFAIRPRQFESYGGGEGGPPPTGRDLIPNAERYRELIDTLAPKPDGGGYGGGGPYGGGGGGYEGGDGYNGDGGGPYNGGGGGYQPHSYEEGPVMQGRRGYRYHGSAQGYQQRAQQPAPAPPPPSYTARANPNYQDPHQTPADNTWNSPDSSTGFDTGFNDGSSFDMNTPFSDDGSFGSLDDDVQMSPFSASNNNVLNSGLTRSFQYGTAIGQSPIGRSENANGQQVYVADLSQLGLTDGEVITDQATLKSILGLR